MFRENRGGPAKSGHSRLALVTGHSIGGICFSISEWNFDGADFGDFESLNKSMDL